ASVPPALVAALSDASHRTQACYQALLSRAPTSEGTMVVRLKVTDDGALCSASVTKTTLPAEMGACVVGVFAHTPLPKLPPGACVDVSVPLRYSRASTWSPGAPVGYRLANGLRVLVVEDHRLPIVGMALRYSVGGRDDARGLSLVTPRLMQRRTKHVGP